MTAQRELAAELRRIGNLEEAEIDLADAALILGALDRPASNLRRYRHHISLLVRDTADLGESLGAAHSLDARIETLNKILVQRYRYEGDDTTYDDLDNANLLRVIDRRRGLPVTLGILYLQVARAQGWPAAAINFPGHFLVRLEHQGERVLIDPFHFGRCLDAQDLRELLKFALGPEAELRPRHYEELGNRGVLLRLQNNIKLRLLESENLEQAVTVMEGMLMFAPGEASLWCDMGLTQTRLDNLRAAIVALNNFLELGGHDPRRPEVLELLHRLQHKLN